MSSVGRQMVRLKKILMIHLSTEKPQSGILTFDCEWSIGGGGTSSSDTHYFPTAVRCLRANYSLLFKFSANINWLSNETVLWMSLFQIFCPFYRRLSFIGF